MFEDIQKLRDINPNLKILVTAIDFGKKDMAEISSSQENRREFAKNAVAFMEKYKFDGLDLDWEFPVWSSMNYKERQNFALLLEELHHEFKKNTTKEYLLTAAVAGDFTIIGPSYEVPSLNKYLDYINLMTYAFNSWHWYWPFTGHNAPLFGSWNDYVYFNRITMAYASEYWANLGMSKEKIVVGIPTYTHTFRLLYGKYLHGVKAPARYEGMETNRAGVCRFLEQEGSSRKWDNDAKVPYAYNDTTWITYEDGESATLKAKWIRDNGYGGAMTYNLNNDDYEGYCSKGQPFPIHKILRNILN
jgi:chitinase